MDIRAVYRDSSLPGAFISSYVPGTQIVERGYTFASVYHGGVIGNVRYLIISNSGKDLRGINDLSTTWGAVLFDAGTIFTVLDVFTLDDLTQITLTTEAHSDGTQQGIIDGARKDFRIAVATPPVDVLNTAEWIVRTDTPLGLDDNGHPFPLS